MLRKSLIILICLLSLPALCLAAGEMRLQIKIGDSIVEGALEDNPVTEQLLKLTPMTMEMKDYNGQERIGYPPEKLSAKGARNGLTPSKGDIALFVPWGNLCVYVKNSTFSDSLVYLGKITSGLDALASQTVPFKSQWIISRQGN